jgi:ATP-dependent RNA helicase DeaD
MQEGGDSSPSAPLALFDGLADPIRKALENRGFTELTDVQLAVLESGAANRDLQISSQTGSGKTVALGMVLAPRLLEEAGAIDSSRPLLALVIVPTRELAVQVSEELRWLYASVPGLTVECVTGGSSVGQERRRLSRRPTVVVGTPGRLNDHIRSNAIDCRRVAEVVLDEADRMLDMGFREELETILDTTPVDRSTHLVSATFAPMIQKLARKYQNKPLSVEGTRLGDANEDIQHVGHIVRLENRYATIVNLLLLAKDERTLVFVNTRAGAAELANRLAADGFTAAPISGELEQIQRTRTLEAFRNGKTTVLVATDVAARGLDIPEVAMIIHTDAPLDSESYTHRSGRTGRAGRKGRSVLLVSPQRRKKVEFLLRRAKVTMKWCDVPTAAAVEKALAKRARRQLREAIAAAPAPTKKQLNFAEALLEDTDAATLVARLVELAGETGKAAPKEISVTPAAIVEEPRYEKRPTYRERPARRERDFSTRAARFEINWGKRDGATPQRLLAMLCRRGDVTSRMIGSIDIESRHATFEVSEQAARQFEQSVGMPDSRDPGLFIRRARRNRR